MAFDQVDYISNFPATFTMGKGDKPKIDAIGVKNFYIHDSIMILGTTNPDGLWYLLSIPDYKPLGSYLKKGEGPLEFMQSPHSSIKSKIYRENKKLVGYLYDFKNGSLKKFNIEETINSGELNLSLMPTRLPPFLANFIMIDSTNFFIKEIGNRDTQQLRYIYSNGEKRSLPLLDKLNQASISEGEDFNILATNTKYNDLQKRFVEAPTGLNYINLYSLDSTIVKTICLDEKLADISDVQKEWPQWNRKYTFVNIQAFDDFFGVIYVNESFKEYETNRKILPSILLFDWDGNPLAKLKMGNHFTHFDIDFNNNELYTYDVHSDEFLKFDVKDILYGAIRP